MIRSIQKQRIDQDRIPRDVGLHRSPPIDHPGDLANELASLDLSSRVQRSVDVVPERRSSKLSSIKRQSANDGTIRPEQHLAPPTVVGRTTQQSDEDILRQLTCGICFTRWSNLVLRCCRHLICDVCFSRCPSKCGICRGIVSGRFPIRFHSMDMIGAIKVTATSNDERDNIQLLVSMGFTRESVKRVIHHCASGGGTTGPMCANGILDRLDFLQREDGEDKELVDSVYRYPTPEELESISSFSEDKTKFSRWLQAAGKCLICRVMPPSICLFPCHHLTICFDCYQGPRKPNFCPDSQCGRKIENQVKIHL